jgi:hypothetical protein
MKTEKKIYRICDNVEVEKIEEVASGIVLKGLKVIEASGNRWASRIIEKKDVDTFEDLKSIVILEIIENNYIISKECYRKINKYLYNYKTEKIKNIEIVVNEEENISNIDKYSYIDYIKEKQSYYENEKKKNRISIELLELTEKQKEVLNIYSKFNSYEKTADILGVTKATVQTTVNRIREKTKKLCYNMEF